VSGLQPLSAGKDEDCRRSRGDGGSRLALLRQSLLNILPELRGLTLHIILTGCHSFFFNCRHFGAEFLAGRALVKSGDLLHLIRAEMALVDGHGLGEQALNELRTLQAGKRRVPVFQRDVGAQPLKLLDDDPEPRLHHAFQDLLAARKIHQLLNLGGAGRLTSGSCRLGRLLCQQHLSGKKNDAQQGSHAILQGKILLLVEDGIIVILAD